MNLSTKLTGCVRRAVLSSLATLRFSSVSAPSHDFTSLVVCEGVRVWGCEGVLADLGEGGDLVDIELWLRIGSPC